MASKKFLTWNITRNSCYPKLLLSWAAVVYYLLFWHFHEQLFVLSSCRLLLALLTFSWTAVVLSSCRLLLALFTFSWTAVALSSCRLLLALFTFSWTAVVLSSCCLLLALLTFSWTAVVPSSCSRPVLLWPTDPWPLLSSRGSILTCVYICKPLRSAGIDSWAP